MAELSDAWLRGDAAPQHGHTPQGTPKMPTVFRNGVFRQWMWMVMASTLLVAADRGVAADWVHWFGDDSLDGFQVVIGTSPFNFPGLLYWDQTNVNTAPQYSNTGSSWNGPFTRDAYMSVTAVSEPTSALMLATGISVLGLSRSHFRQAARGIVA
jgi:hypothetical protein